MFSSDEQISPPSLVSKFKSCMFRPFPSSPGPLFQNEGRCSAFDMEIIFIIMQIKLIFTRTVEHLASFWKWGVLELGSALFSRQNSWKEYSRPKSVNAKSFAYNQGLVVRFAPRLTLSCVRATQFSIRDFHMTSPKFKQRNYQFLWVSTFMRYCST